MSSSEYDEEEIRRLILEAPEMIARYREMVCFTTDYRYRDELVSGGSGFGPRPTMSLAALTRGDEEAAALGNLLKHCILLGTVPPIPLKGFWWIRGVCRGLSSATGSVARMEGHARYLAGMTPAALETDGVSYFIDEMLRVRQNSYRDFPRASDQDSWLTIDEAVVIAEVSERTIYRWLKADRLRVSEGSEGERLFSMNSLLATREQVKLERHNRSGGSIELSLPNCYRNTA